jgi:hypothetical protein
MPPPRCGIDACLLRATRQQLFCPKWVFLTVTPIPPETDLVSRPATQTDLKPEDFALDACSRVRGRERWQVAGIKGNKKLAAAVGVALRAETGIEEAIANPLTGRVLVRYLPNKIEAPVEVLIRRALVLFPGMEPKFSRPASTKPFLLPQLIKAELGCSLLKLLVFGGVSGSVGPIWGAAGVIIALSWVVQRSA